MEQIHRFTRLLIPLPPIESVHSEVKEKIKKTFDLMPEFISNPYIEGFAIPWPSWYGFSSITSTTKAERLRTFFRSMKFEKMCSTILEDMDFIEFLDEDNWEYLSLEDDDTYNEIFVGSYTEKDGSYFTVFQHFIRFCLMPGGIIKEFTYSEIPEFLEEYYKSILEDNEVLPWDELIEKKEKLNPMVESLRKIVRRGLFNSSEVPSDIARDIYKRLEI